jgi:hypothetical protein
MFEAEVFKLLEENVVKTLTINQRPQAHSILDCQEFADRLKKNTSLETLVLHRQFLGPVGIRPIALALAAHPNLTELDLSWNQLGHEGAEILAQAFSNDVKIRRLNLHYNQLGVSGIKALSPFIKKMHLISLNLGANQLGDRGVQILAEDILPYVRSLCQLNLSGNQIGANGIHKLMQALNVHPLDISLDLSANQLNEEAAELIASHLQGQVVPISALDLNHNVLGDGGSVRLARMLGENSILTALSISDNQIGNLGAIELAKVMKTQRYLTRFSCRHSDWQPGTYEAWGNALKANQSLTHLDLYEERMSAEVRLSIQQSLQAHQAAQLAMLEACVQGNFPNVLNYLRQGLSVWSVLPINGNSLLHIAVQQGNAELTILLIQYCDKLLQTVNGQGKSPFDSLCTDKSKALVWYQDVMSSRQPIAQRALLPITPHFMRQLDHAENFDALLILCDILKEFAHPTMQTIHLAAYYNCAEFAAHLIDAKQSKPDISDQIGQTPLMYAKAQSHARVHVVLESRIFYQESRQTRENHFQALLKRLIERGAQQNDTVSIDEDILAISKSDDIAIATECLTERISRLSPLTHVELIAQLSQILQPPQLPMLCLAHEQDWRQSRLGRVFNIALTPKSKLFEPLNKRIRLIQKAIAWLSTQTSENSPMKSHSKNSLNIHYNAIKENLFVIESNYLGYRDALCHATADMRTQLYQRPVRLKGANTGWRILSPEAVQALMLSEQGSHSDTVHGSHTIRVYQHIHWKYDPEAPGIEYQVKQLDQLLFEQGIPETRLLKIEQGEKVHACLGSKTVEGEDLLFILEEHPEYLEKLDLDNFGALVILGLLTDPGDAKPDNFIGKFILTPDGREISQLRLMSIDNDISFIPPIIQRYKGKSGVEQFTEIRNCLYFFPHMNTVVTPWVRERLCSLLPEYTILRWLHALAKQNIRYEALLEQEVFTEAEYVKLKLPIQFLPGTAARVYRKLKKSIDWLREYPSSTLMELFKVVETELYVHYMNVKKRYPAPLDATVELYSASAPSFEFAQELRFERNRRGVIMTSIARNSKSFTQHSNQTVYEAIAEVIEAIDFSNLTQANQHLLIAYISDLSRLSVLTLKNCTILTQALLSDLVQKLSALTVINLINCAQVSTNDLKIIKEMRPNLQIAINPKINQNLSLEYEARVFNIIPSLVQLSLWSVSNYERAGNALSYRGHNTVVAPHKKGMTFFIDAPSIQKKPTFNDDKLIERYAKVRMEL